MSGYDLGTARGVIEIDSSSLGRATAGLDTMAKGMIVAGGAGVAAFVGVVKSGADLEKTLSAVAAVSGATGAEVDSLREKSLELGGSTAYSANEVAGAMEDLAKAGLTIEEINEGATKATIDLAAAAGEELPGGVSRGAEIIANAMKTFGGSAEDLQHYADVLVGAAASSTLTVEDMATSLKYAGPPAAALGLSIDDLSTVLAILGDQGIKGSTAGTSLRGVLLSLAAPTEKAKDAMKELGLMTEDGQSAFFNLDGTMKSIPEIMQILGDKTKNLSEQERVAAFNAIFQRRSMNAAMIMADQGAAGFDKYGDAISGIDAEGTAEKKLDNLAGDMTLLKNRADALVKKAGVPLQDMMRKLVQGLTGVIDKLLNVNPEMLKWGVIIAGVGGSLVALLGTGLLFISMLLKMYRAWKDVQAAISLVSAITKTAFLTNPIFLIVAAIVALAAAFYLAYKKSEVFRNQVHAVGSFLTNTFGPTFNAIVGFLRNAAEQFRLLFNLFQSGSLQAGNFATILDRVFGGTGKLVPAFTMLYNGVKTFIDWLTTSVFPVLEHFIGPILGVLAGVVLYLISPFILVGLAIAALIAGVIWAYNHIEVFRNAIQSVWIWLKEKLGPVLQSLGPLFTAIGNILVGVFKRLPPIFDAAFRLIKTVVETAVKVIINLWNLFGDNIVNAIKVAWDLIKGIVESALKIIQGIIEIVTGILTGDWGKIWEGIKNILAGVWDAMFRIVETAYRAIVLAVQTFFDLIHAIWDTGWEIIKQIVPAAFNFILQIVKAVGEGIINLIKHIVEMIIAPFKYLFDVLVGHSIIPDLMQQMKDVISQGLEAILKFFTELPGKIVRAVGDLTLTLLGKAAELITGFLDSIKELAKDLFKWFTDLPGKILTTLGDLSKLLFNIGRDIIQGLLDGIEDLLGDLWDTFTSITDKIPDLKGPASKDKKLLVKNGQLIMKGLINGVESMVPLLTSQLGDLTTSIPNMVDNSSWLLPGPNTGTNTTQNVTLQFPVVSQGQEETIRDIMDKTDFVPQLIRELKTVGV